jgi:hypothetical protein
MTSGREYDRPALYEIRVRGKLDATWSRWFANLAIVPQPDGESLLFGPIADQAALYGVFSRMRDLGLVLISVHRVPREKGVNHVKPAQEELAEESASTESRCGMKSSRDSARR